VKPLTDSFSQECPDFEPQDTKYPASGEKYQASICRTETKYALPGHGEPGAGCGMARQFVCGTCGDAFVSLSSCMMRECPSCYGKWASALAKRVAWRMWATARHVSQARGVRYWRVVHAIVSFRDEGRSYRFAKARALRVAKQQGIDGGAVVFHPFRTEGGRYVADGYFHYHIFGLALGDIAPGGSSRDGAVVFKVVRDRVHGDFRGFRSPHELARAVSYALKHSGVVSSDTDSDGSRRRRHSVTWFGVASYNQLSTAKLKALHPEGYSAVHDPRGVRCPSCGSRDTAQMGELSVDGVLHPFSAREWYQRNHPCRGQWRCERGDCG
jgi:DNA-directed RNA polymerase subunit RPC12/RpoP